MKQKNKEFDFSSLFIHHKGKWVALDKNETKILGSGSSVKEVVKQARKKGVKIPILFKVPKRLLLFIGFIIND